MIPYSKTYPIIRRFEGTKNDFGAFEEGISSELSIVAHIQPLDAQKELVLLPEGADISDAIVIFSESKLQLRGRQGTPADTIIWRDEEYEIEAETDFMDSPIPHYRYVGTKL